MQENSFLSVLKNRGFTNLWINQILIQLSYNSLNFALLIWVFRLTGSNTAVSAVLFTVYAPAVIFGLFSGLIVDMFDRRKLLIIINLLLCIGFASLIFLKSSYLAILAITFFLNSLAQLYNPTEASSIPLIVKKDQLLMANSLFSTTLFMCFLLGFGLAGPLISLFNIDFVFGLEAALTFIGFLLALRFPSLINEQGVESIRLKNAFIKKDLQDIKSLALLEIKRTLGMIKGNLPVLFSILILAGVQMIIGVMAVLIPGFLENAFHISATDASFIIIAPLGIGMVLGGFVIGKLGKKITRRRLAGAAILITGLMFFMVGITPLVAPTVKHLPMIKTSHFRLDPKPFFHFPSQSAILVLGSFLLGICMVSIVVPSQTVLQENSAEEDRGKIFGVLGVLMAGLSLLPVIFVGLLADAFGTMPIFVGLGGVIAILGLSALKPDFFFKEHQLPRRFILFLGRGHWEK